MLSDPNKPRLISAESASGTTANPFVQISFARAYDFYVQQRNYFSDDCRIFVKPLRTNKNVVNAIEIAAYFEICLGYDVL